MFFKVKNIALQVSSRCHALRSIMKPDQEQNPPSATHLEPLLTKRQHLFHVNCKAVSLPSAEIVLKCMGKLWYSLDFFNENCRASVEIIH